MHSDDSLMLWSLCLDGCTCTRMGVIALRQVHIAFRWMQFHSCPYSYFPVRHIDGKDEDGQLFSCLENLGIDSLTTAPGYDFSREDASIYNTRDLFEYFPRCHFPDQVLANAQLPPVPADPAQSEPQPQPQPDPEPAVLTGLKAQLQQSHDQNVDVEGFGCGSMLSLQGGSCAKCD